MHENGDVRKILLTGASGFVGRAVFRRLHNLGNDVRPVLRTKNAGSSWSDSCIVPTLSASTDWKAVLDEISVVVHLAARVHVLSETMNDAFAEYRSVNVDGTLNLARQAAAMGVRRFVFVSSVKVNGESTDGRGPFTVHDTLSPSDHYGRSKAEAEQGLREFAEVSGMDVVIIRPPLVYGPGVKANFASMVEWVRRGVPLPFGSIKNKRSLVALENLVDLIVTCLDHPAARNQTFMVSDGQDLSTSALLREVALALECPSRLFSVPQPLLEAGLRAIGRSEWVSRLCGNLQVDIKHTCQTLDWSPPVSVSQGLRQLLSQQSI